MSRVHVSKGSTVPLFFLLDLFFSQYTWFTDKTLGWSLAYFQGSVGVYVSAEVCMFMLIFFTASWIPWVVRIRGIIVQSLHNIQKFCNVLLQINSGLIAKHRQTLSGFVAERGKTLKDCFSHAHQNILTCRNFFLTTQKINAINRCVLLTSKCRWISFKSACQKTCTNP